LEVLKMLAEKKPLGVEELEAQTALELPKREMPALVTVILDDTTVQVPISVAANLCDIDVAVLAAQVESGDTTCTATSESSAEN
jgi:hypothetical protein